MREDDLRLSDLMRFHGRWGDFLIELVAKGVEDYKGLGEEVCSVGIERKVGGRSISYLDYGIPMGIVSHDGRESLVYVLQGACGRVGGVSSVELGDVLTFGGVFGNAERCEGS